MAASFDLHTHSTYSDGMFCPEEVVARAAAAGVTCLALTDHDETAGVAAARQRANAEGIELVAGVEISVTWTVHTMHVIGLQVDPDNPELSAGLARLRAGRGERACRIARELERAGIRGSLEGARARAANARLVGRAHFARYLVDAGHAADFRAAFRRWLGSGTPGHVAHQWASLEEAVVWARHAKRFGLLASAGSDFHEGARWLGAHRPATAASRRLRAHLGAASSGADLTHDAPPNLRLHPA